MSDKLGRRPTIASSDICFLVGTALMAFAVDIPMLVIGRFIAGLGVGVTAMVTPMYLAEVTPSHLRGVIVTSNGFCINAGQLVSLLMCLALQDYWRWMFGSSAFFAAAQLLGLLCSPESPRWLLKVGREEQAEKVLMKLYKVESRDQIESVLEEMQVEVRRDPKASYCALLRELFSTSRRAVVVGAGLQAFQQLVGINTAMYYGPTIMKSAGFNDSGREALLAALPIFIAGFLAAIVATTVVDRLGRRWVLLWTIPLMVLGLLGLALGFVLVKLLDYKEVGGWVCLISVIGYVFSFSLGMGPIVWTVNSEIYKLHLRSVANSVSTATNWSFNILVSMTFLSITGSGPGEVAAWLIYAAFAVGAWFWVYLLLPETKGKPLSEILLLFRSGAPGETQLLEGHSSS